MAALLALGVGAGRAAAAQPQPPTNFEDPAIEIDDLFTMNVAVPAANPSLYRSLFISPLQPVGPTADTAQAQRPLVDFMIHSVNGNGDGTGGSYENWVDLRGSYCGQFGWFNRATAVDSLALYVASRASGYPKILADKISIAKTATGWKAQTVQGGKPLVTLEWRRDDARVAQMLQANPWYAYWTAGHGRAYDAPIWAFEPYPNQGPYVKWILTRPDPKTPQRWTSQVGVVRVTVAQGANPTLTEGNWMGLVPKTIEVPGMVEHYQGKGYFTAHRDTCPNPGAAPPPRKGSTPKCLRVAVHIHRHSIGPVDLGESRKRLRRTLGAPLGTRGRALGWCLRGGGVLMAGLDSKHRVRAVATTRVPKRLRTAQHEAERLGRHLFRAGAYRVYGVAHGRVRFVVVADSATMRSKSSIRRAVHELGL